MWNLRASLLEIISSSSRIIGLNLELTKTPPTSAEFIAITHYLQWHFKSINVSNLSFVSFSWLINEVSYSELDFILFHGTGTEGVEGSLGLG